MTNSKEKNTVLESALNNEHLSKTLKDAIREMLKVNEELKVKVNILKNPAKEIKKEKTKEECFAWWNNLTEDWKKAFRSEIGIDDREVDLYDIKRVLGRKEIDINNTPMTDLEPVRDLIYLEKLYCEGANIKSLEPIKDLKNLKEIIICFSGVTDLSPLKNLKSLIELDCENTGVTDLSPLKNLPSLKELHYPEGVNIDCLKKSIESGLYARACAKLT